MKIAMSRFVMLTGIMALGLGLSFNAIAAGEAGGEIKFQQLAAGKGGDKPGPKKLNRMGSRVSPGYVKRSGGKPGPKKRKIVGPDQKPGGGKLNRNPIMQSKPGGGKPGPKKFNRSPIMGKGKPGGGKPGPKKFNRSPIMGKGKPGGGKFKRGQMAPGQRRMPPPPRR